MKIADNKRIDVNFASFKKGENYDFFHFNKKSGEWEYENSAETKSNPKKEELKKEIDRLDRKKQKCNTKNFFVTNYSALLDVDMNMGNDMTKKMVMNKAKKYGLQILDVYNEEYINPYKGKR
ncbi:MAG: hypothetical protein ABEH43_04050, partial [Flavobacteriales bacterium]